MSIKEIKFITENLFLEKTYHPHAFISEFYQTIKKKKNLNPTQIFQKTEVKETFPN